MIYEALYKRQNGMKLQKTFGENEKSYTKKVMLITQWFLAVQNGDCGSFWTTTTYLRDNGKI